MERGRRADDACAVDLQDSRRSTTARPISARSSSGTATSRTRSCARRRPASRRCCCRSRCSSRSATRSRASATTASIRRSTRRRPARRSCKAIDAVRGGASARGRRSPMNDWIRALVGARRARGARRGRWSASSRRRARCRARPGTRMVVTRGRDRRHDRRRPSRVQGDRHRARPARRARAARAPPLSAGREPRPVLRRRRPAAVRAGACGTADWLETRRSAARRTGVDCALVDAGARRRRRASDWSSPRRRRSARWARRAATTRPRRSPATLLARRRRAAARDARRRRRRTRGVRRRRCARPISPIVLFGAGHVGRALVRALAGIDCRIQWVDTRDDAFPADDARTTSTAWSPTRPRRKLRRRRAGAYFLVMTHSHPLDEALAERILRARRLRLLRADRLGVEAAPVRAAAGGARHAARRASRR